MRLFTKTALAVALLSTNAFANINANNGFYIGGNLNSSAYSTVPGAAWQSSFIPLRLYVSPVVGYHFNDYVAVESSYNYIVNDNFSGNEEMGPDHYRLYTIDLSAKLIMPFHSGFSLFAQPGIAYTHQSVFNQSYRVLPPSADTNDTRLLPLLGAGVSYNFTPNVSTDISFKHVFGMGGIGDINTLGVGISYTFGGN